MYQGKRMKKSKKTMTLLASLVLVLGIVVAGTVAFLVTNTNPVVNTFTPTNVSPEIHEEFNGTVKSNVKIENTGDANAYIRAAVMVNWVDESRNVLGQVPVKGTDYTITYDLANGWVQGDDGYYYWTKIVPATSGTDVTGVLITEAKVLKAAPVSGYSLSVEILAQTIQADGFASDGVTRPVTDAWGVAVNKDGTLAVQ